MQRIHDALRHGRGVLVPASLRAVRDEARSQVVEDEIKKIECAKARTGVKNTTTDHQPNNKELIERIRFLELHIRKLESELNDAKNA